MAFEIGIRPSKRVDSTPSTKIFWYTRRRQALIPPGRYPLPLPLLSLPCSRQQDQRAALKVFHAVIYCRFSEKRAVCRNQLRYVKA